MLRSNHCVPPGLSLQRERKYFLLGLLTAGLISIALFSYQYANARHLLFATRHSRSVLIPGAVIAPLEELLSRVFDPLFLLALCLPVWVALHYMHYRRGSMSIYLMRRLPDRNLLHRQCWTLPLLALAAILLTAVLLLALYYLIYRYATPAQCLPAAYRRF